MTSNLLTYVVPELMHSTSLLLMAGKVFANQKWLNLINVRRSYNLFDGGDLNKLEAF